MKRVMKMVFLATIAMAVVFANAATPQSLVSESTMLNGQSRTGTGNTYAHVIDGQTAYVEYMKGGVTKITNLNGVQTASTLFTQAYWGMVSGGATSLTAFYGFGMSGNYLIWTDTASDAVWKADKTTGVISNVVSRSTITSYLGRNTTTELINTLAPFTVAPNGGLTFYVSETKTLLNTNLNGNLTTVATLSSSINSGLTYDALGNLYWSDNTSDDIYRLTSGGVVETVVSGSAIRTLTGYTSGGVADAYVNDILYCGNNKIYFYEARDKSILEFDLNNPTNGLAFLVDNSGLAQTFGLYNNAGTTYLTYHAFTGDLMMVIPEPATLALLALGGLVLNRSRKH